MPSRAHIGYPVKLGPGGRLLANEQDSDEEVADCIAVILSWPIGTRQGAPEFGTPNELFESGGPHLGELRDAVTANEPRATAIDDTVLDGLLKRGIATVRFGFDQRVPE